MQWASAVAEDSRLEEAVARAAASVAETLGGRTADLALVFVSPRFADGYARVPGLVAQHLEVTALMGCSAGGVIGGGHEVEQRPAVALMAALLPGVEMRGFQLGGGRLPDALSASGLARVLQARRPEARLLLVLADPFSADIERLLRQLDLAFPGCLKLGGLASGGREPGGNALFLHRESFGSGIVGMVLSGNLRADAIVAQGCRPVGEPMFVTAAHGHWLQALDGEPALDVLGALHERLAPADQALARHSLFVGLGLPGRREQYAMGDFLIRNIAGADPQRGALAIAAEVQPGAVVQFHLRDARTSADDLRALLRRYADGAGAAAGTPAGALLFSCQGRGQGLYGEADHDTRLLREHLGAIPVGGFFCSGEIGPVQGTTYLHGYTSAFAILRPRGFN